MSPRSNRWMVILLCVNILLVTAIVFEFVRLPQAYGQVRANDYILVPGNLYLGRQIVWIIDLRTHQLTSCMYNPTRNIIEFGQAIDLTRQFR